MMTNSAALRTKFSLAAPALRAAAARLWQPDGLGQSFPAYLSTMHTVIRASVPLMELAARRCVELGPSDPVAGRLHAYLTEHIAEERYHDEWLLADLAALGADPGQPLRDQPPPVVASLVGAQYYWIAHYHPVVLLGYIAVLEDNAPAGWFADWIVSTSDVPEAAVRTVRAHAELDRGHADAVFDLLDSLELPTALQHAVAVSGLYTIDSLVGLFARMTKGDRVWLSTGTR
ncbi:iron-containing redox enzyme family protein [Dactylosporangium sp. CA-092794]|uniref:iron-containing redox enzyme family protein n=1 Tax=Dactylosporangium sp. CA-092794 TaxID=3239929 RepID=UPI003D90F38B